MFIQLYICILLHRLEIFRQHFILRQQLRKKLEEGKELNQPEKTLVPHTLVESLDISLKNLVVVIESRAVYDGADDVGDNFGGQFADVEWLALFFSRLMEEVAGLFLYLTLQTHLAHAKVSQTGERESAMFSPHVTLREHDTWKYTKNTIISGPESISTYLIYPLHMIIDTLDMNVGTQYHSNKLDFVQTRYLNIDKDVDSVSKTTLVHSVNHS